MNEISKYNTTQNMLAQVAQAGGAAGGAAGYMKFSKGEWLFGREGLDASDQKWLVNVNTFEHGMICWDQGQKFGEVNVPFGVAVDRNLLEPAPDDVLGMYPISTAVNNVRNQGPQLLEPIEEAQDLGLQE